MLRAFRNMWTGRVDPQPVALRPTEMSLPDVKTFGQSPICDTEECCRNWTMEDWDRWVIAIDGTASCASIAKGAETAPQPASPKVTRFYDYVHKAGRRSFEMGEKPGGCPSLYSVMPAAYGSDHYRVFDVGYMEAMSERVRAQTAA